MSEWARYFFACSFARAAKPTKVCACILLINRQCGCGYSILVLSRIVLLAVAAAACGSAAGAAARGAAAAGAFAK